MKGNNRTRIALEQGVPAIKVEVKYFNGAEEVDGPYSPDNIIKNAVHADTIFKRKTAAENIRSLVQRPTKNKIVESEFFEFMGENGALEEFPEIAEYLNKYIYDIDFNSLSKAENSYDYISYFNTLQNNLKKLTTNNKVRVSRTEGYADPKAKKKKTYLEVPIKDVAFSGNADEKELILKVSPNRFQSVRLESK